MFQSKPQLGEHLLLLLAGMAVSKAGRLTYFLQLQQQLALLLARMNLHRSLIQPLPFE